MRQYEIIERRRSVRTFLSESLRESTVDFINHYIEKVNMLKGPFGHSIKLYTHDMSNQKRVGTYGIIKNPAMYIAGTTHNSIEGIMDYGYLFERMILDFTEKNIGTCWMAGTFKRDDFDIIKEDEIMPAVTPIGYFDNTRFFENMMRKVVKSDLRLPFEQLFFDENFETPLKEEKAGPFKEALMAVRIGPSASNKQPWRVLKQANSIHLYLEENKKYNETLPFKVQYLDMGIAMYHLEAILKENDFEGQWIKEEPDVKLPNENYKYIVTYK